MTNMHTREEYNRLAITAIMCEWGSAPQMAAENKFCDMLREDGLWSPKMEDLKMDVVNRMTVGICLRIDADFKAGAIARAASHSKEKY